jgi:tetratricopeptide (TPR) repeat protein
MIYRLAKSIKRINIMRISLITVILLVGIGCSGINPKKDNNITKPLKENSGFISSNEKNISLKKSLNSVENNVAKSLKEKKLLTSSSENNISLKKSLNSVENNVTKSLKEKKVSVPFDEKNTSKKEEVYKSKVKKLAKEIDKLLENPNKQNIDNAYNKLKELTSICKDKKSYICAVSYKNKAKIEELKGEYSKAIEDYTKSINSGIKDNEGSILEKIADIYYLHLNNIPKAIQTLKELTDNPHRKKDSKLYYQIGALYLEQGKYKDAKINIQKSKNLGNRDAEYLWYKHELYKY